MNTQTCLMPEEPLSPKPERVQPSPILALSRRLAGLGVMATLVLLALILIGLAVSGPGDSAVLAAPAQAALSATGNGPHTATITPTIVMTAFLPLAVRTKPPEPNVWQAEYFTNHEFGGLPAYTQEETRIDYDWGSNGAPLGLPKDYFSIRWTGIWEFEAGEYTFFLDVDDGAVLWLDEEDPPLVDEWHEGSGAYQATVHFDTPGTHRLRLHYLEWTGAAHVSLHWRRTDIYPLWQGDYYAEPWVEGGWDRQQMDSAIQFDWGSQCPEGLPCDSFSVQWQASPLFPAGTYRLFMFADEGFRLFIDGRLRDRGGWDLNEPGGAQDNMVDMYVSSSEQREITFDFHDQGGLAEARLWIQSLDYPRWKVEFFANPFLNGAPVATEYYHAAFEDWGYGRAHDSLPTPDSFSIRWSGDRYFHTGCYRFFVFADDGARLWINGEQLIDEWYTGRGTHSSPVTCLTTGYHEVILEYYENTNEAEIRFWWE